MVDWKPRLRHLVSDAATSPAVKIRNAEQPVEAETSSGDEVAPRAKAFDDGESWGWAPSLDQRKHEAAVARQVQPGADVGRLSSNTHARDHGSERLGRRGRSANDASWNDRSAHGYGSQREEGWYGSASSSSNHGGKWKWDSSWHTNNGANVEDSGVHRTWGRGSDRNSWADSSSRWDESTRHWDTAIGSNTSSAKGGGSTAKKSTWGNDDSNTGVAADGSSKAAGSRGSRGKAGKEKGAGKDGDGAGGNAGDVTGSSAGRGRGKGSTHRKVFLADDSGAKSAEQHDLPPPPAPPREAPPPHRQSAKGTRSWQQVDKSSAKDTVPSDEWTKPSSSWSAFAEAAKVAKEAQDVQEELESPPPPPPLDLPKTAKTSGTKGSRRGAAKGGGARWQPVGQSS